MGQYARQWFLPVKSLVCKSLQKERLVLVRRNQSGTRYPHVATQRFSKKRMRQNYVLHMFFLRRATRKRFAAGSAASDRGGGSV
jgi:hypothetical protein